MLEINDIKVQLFEAKKNILKLQSENAALKVNLRKTKDSMRKKEKLIDDLVDPKKPNYFCKELSVRSASLVITLSEENEQLKRDLSEKEVMVKKLQREIDSIKAYTNLSKTTIKRMKSSHHEHKFESHLNIAGKSTARSTNKSSVRSTKGKLRCFSATDYRTESGLHISLVGKKSKGNNFPDLSSPHLNENIENINSPKNLDNIVKSLQNLETFLSTFNPDKVNRTDEMEIIHFSNEELGEDVPHEEIKQLQNSFQNIIGEVKSLKNSLLEVQKDQQKEENDPNFEEVSKKIEELVNNYTLNKLSIIINEVESKHSDDKKKLSLKGNSEALYKSCTPR